jgi:predicted RNA-binding Zn ribbon-like protein
MDKQMESVPAWSLEEEKPAPMPLLLVQGFVNTLDLETGTDVLTDAEEARSWLITSGLLNRQAEISSDDLTFAREVRESIRSLLAADGDVDPARLGPLRALADAHRARLSVSDHGALALENSRRVDPGDALFELLLIIRAAQQDGTWKRLKACANPECAWAFYDRSRNQQGSWCEMAVCGNRLKNRQFRARRR